MKTRSTLQERGDGVFFPPFLLTFLLILSVNGDGIVANFSENGQLTINYRAIFDNFEWALGTSVRFGVQYVNYTSLERTPKASMFQFLNWFKEHEAGGNATMRM
jgi:hypothetical protein